MIEAASQHTAVISLGDHIFHPLRMQLLEGLARSVYNPSFHNIFFAEAAGGNIEELRTMQMLYQTQDSSERSWFKALADVSFSQHFGRPTTAEEAGRAREWYQAIASQPNSEGFWQSQLFLVEKLDRDLNLLFEQEAYDPRIVNVLSGCYSWVENAWDQAWDLVKTGELQDATQLTKYAVKEESVLMDIRENRVVNQMVELFNAAKHPTILLGRFGTFHNGIVDKLTTKVSEEGLPIEVMVNYELGERTQTFKDDVFTAIGQNPTQKISDEMARRILLNYILIEGLYKTDISIADLADVSQVAGRKFFDSTVEDMLIEYPTLGIEGTIKRTLRYL